MENIQVSIVASATRPILENGFRNWERFLLSLKRNKINYEVIFVGHVKCPYPILDKNFKYIHATVKPAQCYEIGFREAKGECLHWTADDADYVWQHHADNIDRAYNAYKKIEAQNGNDRKTMIAMRPVEDGSLNVWDFHHFFGGWHDTPVMAPFGLFNREMYHELGGYDRRFVSGQSENDVVMRFLEAGGRVHIEKEAYLYVHHRQVHPKNPKENKFREWYPTDRKILEDCWVVGGYGSYEGLRKYDNDAEKRKHITLVTKRQLPVERFEDRDDICTVTQGITGRWKND